MKTKISLFACIILIVVSTIIASPQENDDELLMSIGADFTLQLNLVSYFDLEDDVNAYSRWGDLVDDVMARLDERFKSLSSMNEILDDIERLSQANRYDINPVVEVIGAEEVVCTFEQRYGYREYVCSAVRINIHLVFSKSGVFQEVYIGKSHSEISNNDEEDN